MKLMNYVVAALIGVLSFVVAIAAGFAPWDVEYWAIAIPVIAVGNYFNTRYI